MKRIILAGLLVAESLAGSAVMEISPKVVDTSKKWTFELRNKERRTIYVSIFGTDIIFQPIASPSGITESSINALRTTALTDSINNGYTIHMEIGIAKPGKQQLIDVYRKNLLNPDFTYDYNAVADELFVKRFIYKLEPYTNTSNNTDTRTIFLSWESGQYLKVQTGTGSGDKLKTQSGISFVRANNLPLSRVTAIDKDKLPPFERPTGSK